MVPSTGVPHKQLGTHESRGQGSRNKTAAGDVEQVMRETREGLPSEGSTSDDFRMKGHGCEISGDGTLGIPGVLRI